MRLMNGILLAYLILCLFAIFPRPLALAWTRFWHAVALVVWMHLPWRVARDRARRRFS